MSTPPRPRAIAHPGRFAVVAIGLMAVASLLLFAGMESDTGTQEKTDTQPSEIVSTIPTPNSLNKPEQSITIELRADLTGVLIVDGNEIPEDQLSRPTQATMVFQPGPGKDVTKFATGNHTVQILYWPGIRTRDDAASWSYTFRTTA